MQSIIKRLNYFYYSLFVYVLAVTFAKKQKFMLRVADIIADRGRIINGLRKKNLADAEQKVESAVLMDKSRKQLQTDLEQVLSEANGLAKQIGQLMKEGKKSEADEVKTRTSQLKSSAKLLQDQLRETEQALQEALYNIPNVAHDDVPAGRSAENNVIVESYGVMPQIGEDALPHWDLIKKYDIVDFDSGNKISGAGFPVYKGKGAKLQRALISFFLDEAERAGYLELQPPVIINADSGYGTGQLPDKEGQMYGITESDLYLIPTAEVPITNIYRDVILKEDQLPIKHVGYSLCFRREAGSWGADVRGLNRLHQFDKVEIVQITKAEHSYRALEEMCDHVCGLLSKLEVPFRKVLLCGGDMGFTSAKTYDMEVYSAAQAKWLEVSSVSNFETYQANRLKLRYRSSENKSVLLHTLNGSALALPRVLAAILENNQSPDGIRIPKVLTGYTGFDAIT